MAWSREQQANARTVISVGRAMGMSERDILIGLMTAMQESGLRNLNYGDRDSLGLFQQRPSQGWGTRSQVTDPVYASRKFFAGLKGLGGRRNSMPLWSAAQSVQRSAFPRAYAKHEGGARGLLESLGGRPINIEPALGRKPKSAPLGANTPGIEPEPDPAQGIGAPVTPGIEAASGDTQGLTIAPGIEAPDQPIQFPQVKSKKSVEDFLDAVNGSGVDGVRAAIIAEAKKYLGTPYVWGGSKPGGFDCSGLLYYVFRKFGIKIPRVSYDQARWGKATGIGNISPGDFVAWDHGGPSGADHIALYLGNGKILEAPRSGLNVRIRDLGKGEGAYGVKLRI